MGLAIFKLLLLFIGITGYFFAIYFVYLKIFKSTDNGEKLGATASRFYIIFLYFMIPLWLFSPFFIQLFSATSELSPKARDAYMSIIAFFFIFYSLSSAFYFNYLKRLVESKFLDTKSNIFLALRILVIMYGALCVNSSISTIKAVYYQFGNAEYVFKGPKIKALVKLDSTKQIQSIQTKEICCSVLLEKLKNVPDENLLIEDKNSFSLLINTYKINIKPEYDLEINYNYIYGSRGNISDHKLIFKDSQCECNLELGKVNQLSFSKFDRKEIELKLDQQINNFRSVHKDIEEKPEFFVVFSYSKFCGSLGLRGYGVSGDNETAHTLDFILLWLFNIIVGSLIFIVGKIFLPVKK